MKKKALLLFSLLFTYFSISAATPYTICEDGEQVLTATKVGKSYQWFLDDVKIEGATQNTYTAKKAGKYTCEITQEGGEEQKFNLVEYGNFDWAPQEYKNKRQQPITSDPLTGKSYTISYVLQDFDEKGKADPGHSTTTPNPNKIKSQYFSEIFPKGGTHMLACDGGEGKWQVWNVRDMKLKGGVEYQFSCFAANIDKEYETQKHGTISLPKIAFEIEAEGIPRQKIGKGLMTLTEDLGKWDEYKATFTPPHDCSWAHLYIVNQTAGKVGNDFALDEVYFGAVPTSEQVVKEVFEVEVNTIPTVTLTQPKPECEGLGIQLVATITNAQANPTLEWSQNGTPITGKTETTIDIIVPEADKTDTYQLSVTNGVCKPVTAETTVTGKACGNPPIEHPSFDACLSSTISLEPETPEAECQGYEWDNGSIDRVLTLTADKLDEQMNICTITLKNGTTLTEKFPYFVKLCEDTIKFSESICLGEEYEFHGNVYTETGIYPFDYTTEEGIKLTEILYLTVNEPSTVEFTDSICQGEAYQDYGFSFTSAETQNPGSYDFMNNGINVGGCDSTTILHLEIFPLPVFETMVDVQTMEVQVNVGTEPFLYTLDDSQGFTTNYFEKLAVGKHTIQVTDAHQCSSSQEFEIESIPLKPNVYFSPNGDGNHDLWYIEGIEFYPNAIIQIYDRNNKQIAHFLVPDFKGWDGQYNGHGMPADDYWYLLTVPELGKQYSGHFTLKR